MCTQERRNPKGFNSDGNCAVDDLVAQWWFLRDANQENGMGDKGNRGFVPLTDNYVVIFSL